MDVVPEGDDVIPLECSDEAEELRGLFGLADILPTLPHKDEAKEGALVVGGLHENISLLDLSSVEPSPAGSSGPSLRSPLLSSLRSSHKRVAIHLNQSPDTRGERMT
ncbi:hypothetical protein GBAR_LOCUS23923 [Geodia barretti]|uniref:Uncharacterized protein n=1 Tax=Geodia barretti TaxID=519541 RepID=A0AA35TA32_GEOBA|nr:hypothetical protein GBAR_LOCUS23923 [Geodia barretti]